MLNLLKVLFTAILVSMLWVTIGASLDRGVLDAAEDLWPDPWFRATLADAYFGFLTVYVWVAYKERTLLARSVWLVAFLGLGNIAIAVYVLIQLFKAGRGASLQSVLLRQA
jgi:hypothetical protein